MAEAVEEFRRLVWLRREGLTMVLIVNRRLNAPLELVRREDMKQWSERGIEHEEVQPPPRRRWRPVVSTSAEEAAYFEWKMDNSEEEVST
ncbi:MAG: hypothetical protein ACTS5P_02265 [Candidatus Hodgkinia cicadicola]